jgi:integrase
MEQCENKSILDIKRIDILKLQNWLLNEQNLSPARIRFIKSSVSSWCNYIENYYGEDYPKFRNIVNKVEHPAKSQVRDKTYLTQEQIDDLFGWLEMKQDWLKLSLLSLALSSGARKAELFQVKKDCINNKIKDNMYKSNVVRGKGRGQKGKQFSLTFDEKTAEYIRKYLSIRGKDDCEYLFTTKKDGLVEPLSPTIFNSWCEIFSKYLEVPVYPHAFRSSRATLLVESGVPIEKVKTLLKHESVDTTAIYVRPRDDEDMEDIFSL